MSTYLTTNELSEKTKYEPRTIRVQLKDYVLLKGVHYIRPLGAGKVLYILEEVETTMLKSCSIFRKLAEEILSRIEAEILLG